MSKQLIGKSAYAVFVSLCMLFSLLTPGQDAQALEPQRGGTLVVGMEMEPRGFDPIEAGYLSARARSHIVAIEEKLFTEDAAGNIIPELALAANPSDDRMNWTITLRQGVRFHDGTPFNADAVVGHWQRMLEPKNKFRGSGAIQPVASVSKVDAFTVLFTLKHPWTDFLPYLTSPAAIASYIPSPAAVAAKTQNRAPVGTGPFMFKEWLSGDRLVVVRNPDYWRKGQPFLDQIVYRTMPDMQTRFASLQSGEVDLIYTDMGKDILAAQRDASLQVWASDNNGAGIFYFNTTKPPTNDIRVRRALAHAWNQEQYIQTIHAGVHPVAKDPFGIGSTCGDVSYREPNLEVARQLIKEYGKPVELEFLHSSTPRGREAGAIIQQMFKQIGVTVKPVPVTLPQMARSVFKNNFQMSGWTLYDSPAIGVALKGNLHSKSRGNVSHYQNVELDQLLDLQRTSPDAEARKEALCKIATIINDDVPLLYRLGWRHHMIGQTRVHGVDDPSYAALRVNKVWVTPETANLQAQK